MKNIKICKIGHFNHSVDVNKLKDWKSNYFKILSTDTVSCIKVDHFGDDYIYPNEKIISDIGDDENGIDVNIAIIDQPLEGNFYMHRLSDKKVVISIFPVIEILNSKNIPIENYLLRCIYETVIFLYEGYGLIDKNIYKIPHHETRRCLFDMNVFIERVAYSSIKPIICNECKIRLEKKSLPDNFVKNIEKELKKINYSMYFRIENEIKKRPILYLMITILFALVLNILANFIYDSFKVNPNNSKEVRAGKMK